jgi:hypothetical protein
MDSENIYQSISSTGTMSRQGSIFYDASEALGINDEKDDMGKVVDI